MQLLLKSLGSNQLIQKFQIQKQKTLTSQQEPEKRSSLPCRSNGEEKAAQGCWHTLMGFSMLDLTKTTMAGTTSSLLDLLRK